MRTGLTISALLHVALLLWAGLSFSSRPLVAAAPDSLPVDIISDKQFSELTAGNRNAPKAETPKPLVDKVDAPKPATETVAAIAEKPEIKPLAPETKADPAPPEIKPPEPKPSETKSEPKPQPTPDPIAEALKKEDARKAAEAKAKAAAAKKQSKFNPDQIAAMLDKRDPRRQAALGDTVNQNPTLGVSSGSAPSLSVSEIDALRRRLAQLWNPPAGALNPQDLVVKVRVKLGRDGKLASPPIVMTAGRGTVFEAARDGAVRALFQAQPYDMLRVENYELWKEMEIVFDPREMVPG
jgi:outer membrane biosynthesis protein TonB